MRPLLAGLLVGYLLFIGWVVLWPSSVPASATVNHTYDVLRALHLAFGWVTPTRVEFGLNVLMVVPVALLAGLVWPRWSWHRWTAWAFVASGSVELFQGLFLPDRTAAFSDVVANTLGALTGGAAAQILKRSRACARLVKGSDVGQSPKGAKSVVLDMSTRADEATPMILESEQRPWGSWHVIDVADGYKIKRIHVAPGGRLSLQTHEHRSEHWVVIQGAATCTINDEVIVASEGESVDVAQGARHRLANAGDVELVIVEVQLGHYTGEDDICRLEDDYGRSL